MNMDLPLQGRITAIYNNFDNAQHLQGSITAIFNKSQLKRMINSQEQQGQFQMFLLVRVVFQKHDILTQEMRKVQAIHDHKKMKNTMNKKVNNLGTEVSQRSSLNLRSCGMFV